MIKELVEQRIVDAIGDGVSIQNTQYKILYENKAQKELIGDHEGGYCYEAYQQKDNICEDCPLFITFKDGKMHTTERNIIVDNEDKYFQITASPIRNSEGEIIAGIEVVRDITARKRDEEALKASEEKYRLLFSAEQDAIILVDSETRRIVDANDSAFRLYEYGKEEFLKMRGPDLSAEPEKSDAAIAEIALSTDKKIHYHTRSHKKKDGTVFPVEISSGTFMTQGRKIISAVIRDITERQKALETLIQSSFYLDNINDTLIVLGDKREIVKVNKEFSNLWGYSSEEVLGKPVSLLFPEEDMPKHLSEMKEAVSTKKPRNFETVALTKSGEKVLLSIRGSAIFDEDGKLEGFIGIFRDITEKKHIEEKLKESEEQYRQLSEATFEGVIVHDKGKILDVNQNFTTMFRYDKSELIGMNGFELFAPESRDSSVKKIMSGYEKPYEAIGLRKDGKIFHMEIRGKSTFYKGYTARIATVRDITERKQAEETLHDSEERFRSVAENANDAIIYINGNGEIIFWNHAAEHIFGYSAEEVVGSSISLILPERYRVAHLEGMNRVMKTGESKIMGKTVEMSGLRKDGSEFPLELSISTWKIREEVYFTAVIRDITKRKHSEEVIERQVSRLSALRSIDKAIVASLDLNVTLEVFITHLMRELKIDAASVLLLNQYTQMLEYVISKGFKTSALKYTRLRLGESNAGRAAMEHHIINIPNLKKEPSGFIRSHLLAEEGFISYFAVPLIAKGEVNGVIELFHRSQLDVEPEWVEFLEAIADQGAIVLDNSFMFNKLKRSNIDLTLAYDRTIEGWSRALDMRDKETEGHSQRVTEMTLRIAQEFQIKGEELVHIRRGALLHDIGKMGIPDNILLKPGKLTEEEWIIMKLHPVYARDLLYPIEYLRPAIDISFSHHERWDGTGYPTGLKGENIPLAARIFAVVDVWDALSSDRPYRPAWPKEKVLEHIRSGVGTHFDAGVVEIFFSIDQEKYIEEEGQD
jgi:PAS domain S-box-containing protein